MRVKIGLGILCFAGAAMAASAQSAQTTTPRAGDKAPPVDTSRSSQPGTHGTMRAPAMASDCTNDGWRGYTSPKFKSEKACQSYVKKHMKKGTSGETNAPKSDMSSGTGANTGTTNSTQPRPTPHP